MRLVKALGYKPEVSIRCMTIGVFHLINPSDSTVALGSSQPNDIIEYQDYLLGCKGGWGCTVICNRRK